jgi:hypothetical protein
MYRERPYPEIFRSLLLTAIFTLASPSMLWAQAVAGGVDLGGAALHMMNADIGPLAPLISALFWVTGGVLMGAGALKLKEHAENPTQTPMRQGIARMAVGAVLMTIPFFSQFVTNTLSNTAGPAGYTAFVMP